jgi:hypothetical protein
MEGKKIATIVANIVAGFLVTGVMILMLPLHLAIPFGLFSAWMWIGAPLALLWAKEKEDKKKLLDSP